MVNDLIAHVQKLIADGAHTKAGLAKAAGLHANTLREADSPDWTPNAKTLIALEAYLFPKSERAA